jgi:hypothetical protein
VKTLENKDSAGNTFALNGNTASTTPDNIYDSNNDSPTANTGDGNRDTLESDSRRAWVK